MPPRRKAAGAAAKKGKKDVKKEEEVESSSVEASQPAAVVKAEEETESQSKQDEPQDSSTSTLASSSAADVKPPSSAAASQATAASKTATRSSGRASTRRGGKKAATTEDNEDSSNKGAEAAEGPEVDIKSGVKDRVQVKEEQPASGATVDASEQSLKPAAADEDMTSGATTPASQRDDAPTPDIMGVIENREDEDFIMDDAEPAPTDAEEVRRLKERPAEAVDTSSQPAPLYSNSGNLASKQLNEGLAAREAIRAEASTSRNGSAAPSDDSGSGAPLTREERMAKMNALRKRMNESATANRKDVVTAQNEHRKALSESKRLERKRKQAEAMGEKLEAMETGEDLERKKNWEYSLADNEAWSKKQARKERRMDTGFSTFDEAARRKYRRDMDNFKPDLKSYQAQKAAALGLTPEEAAQIGFNGEGSSEIIPHASTSTGTQLIPGSDQLYRDANSFVYADHKPSDDAIDRVVGKLNLDLDKRAKRSRARVEDEGDITYINDRNKVFNKKLERYFNKYTDEIKSNFERGTAL